MKQRIMEMAYEIWEQISDDPETAVGVTLALTASCLHYCGEENREHIRMTLTGEMPFDAKIH